jgi:deoxycytidylate deaminase
MALGARGASSPGITYTFDNQAVVMKGQASTLSTTPQPFRIVGSLAPEQASRAIIGASASNELVFAVVGHAGSGTSTVAIQLSNLLSERQTAGQQYEVVILKAREVISEWAERKGSPREGQYGTSPLEKVRMLQDYGDDMRAEENSAHTPDYAAIARALAIKIKAARAKQIGVESVPGTPVKPDGKPRAYILDSLRHPEEVNLLRRVYSRAFVLVGVVCEEERRRKRISDKYEKPNPSDIEKFMARDADADQKYGQHVADAFHLADYFIDNTEDRGDVRSSNPSWEVVENLSRLVKIVTHAELVRPMVAETAMYHAFSAQMQSACLSRQVGAAVVDTNGNILATGTNEVPKAGGGVYGESFEKELQDSRCAFFADPAERYCRNTRSQSDIIENLITSFKEEFSEEKERDVRELIEKKRSALSSALRKTRVGALLEFSRAVHAEMDALLSAARKGISLVGTRLFVTTFPCHYCARHIVAAGVDEVQYIEPYPKSQALKLHKDSIQIVHSGWSPPSQYGQRKLINDLRDSGEGSQPAEPLSTPKILIRPFSGIAPRLYERAFMKDRELKKKETGEMLIQGPSWGTPWHLSKLSPSDIEVQLEGVNANV